MGVDDVDGDFHFAKREETGTWLNTGLHYQAWAAIQAAGEYSTANWVVKLDADAVMIPSRLKYWLSDKYVPPEGIYLENCKYVKYGRGSLRAELPGRERRQAWDRIRLQAGWDVRGRPATRGEEEQEVEAQLRHRCHHGVPPADEARGLGCVLRGHHDGVPCVPAALISVRPPARLLPTFLPPSWTAWRIRERTVSQSRALNL